jgi:hypothetical protein
MFGARLPNAVSLSGKVLMDRLELLVVPGLLAVAQYHIQPSDTSAVTIPIGHVTTDPDRIARISALLQLRVKDAQSIEVLWPGKKTEVQDLVDTDWLGLALEEDPNHQAAKGIRTQTIRWKGRGRIKS